MSALMPNLSRSSHLDAITFKATAELAADLCSRGLEATTDALNFALQKSQENTKLILSAEEKSFQERGELLHKEGKREQYFRDFGRAQHLAASTVLTYATLDTVLAEATRLLEVHAGIKQPRQNNQGAMIFTNLKHIENSIHGISPLSSGDHVVLDDFTNIRNTLIHDGNFVKEAQPQVGLPTREQKRILALIASEHHQDYFEIRPGFPILLRDYGVGHFVAVCCRIIKNVTDAVYQRLLACG